MKHSIVLKFIAVFLCAASLLGIAGSAVGIFAMAELGLYERSFDEAYKEYTENYADMLAYDIAVRYAATALGGCNTQMVDVYYGNLWSNSTYDWSSIGYELKDAEGEVLQSYELENGTPEFEFTFPVGGDYVKVLNTMTEAEKNAQEMATAPTEEPLADIHVSVIPEGDMEVYGFTIQYADGSSEGTDYADTPIGYLSWQGDGGYLFQSYEDLGWLELVHKHTATYIAFRDIHGMTVYQATASENVLYSYSYNGGTTFMELFGQVETIDQGDAVLYDAIPPGGTTVSRITVSYADGSSESIGGVPELGFISYDESGCVVFTAYAAGILDFQRQRVIYIAFSDEIDNLIYEASSLDGVGTFYYDEGESLCFRVDLQAEEDAPAAVPSGEVYIYDDVPPPGYAVHRVDLWLKDSTSMYTVESDETIVGIASHDAEGNVIFTAENWQDFAFSKPAEVVYILLTDANDRKIFEAHTEGVLPGSGGDVIGTFAYNGDGELVFTVGTEKPAVDAGEEIVPMSTIPEVVTIQETIGEDSIAAFEETVPEDTVPVIATTEEAVPETTVEATLPEAIEVTVPEITEVTQPVTAAGELEIPESTDATAATVETVIPEATEVAAAPETAAEEMNITEPVTHELRETTEGVRYYGYYDYDLGEHMVVEYTYEEMPEYTVEIVFAPGAMAYDYEWRLLEVAYSLGDQIYIILAECLLVFAIMAVYLCCVAGKKNGSTEIHAGGLNCIPLDLYLGGGFLAEMALFWVGAEGVPYLLRSNFQVALVFALLVAYAMCLVFVAFCFACAAQFKTPGGYWWRNSICGRCLRLIARGWNWLIKACVWLGQHYDSKLEPMLIRFFKACWKLLRFFWGLLVKTVLWLVHLLQKGTNWMGDKLVRFFSMLPLTWQWLVTAFGMMLLLLLVYATNMEEFVTVICICVYLGIVLYGTNAFGTLLEAVKRMSKGDLDEKIDDKLLIGSFKDFAKELNGLADVAVVAAQKQLKSERMKTELITNVSHDIKTPLTSIINYVDLLQKPHTPEEQEVYLEVLDRQSQRLKKLIEDLMEMSKASTGNLAVDIQKVNAAEAINQALGEFADKLDRAQLIPVFRQPEEPIEMMADGRLVWRVMSNLLGNAVKYALPGTRVYLDLVAVDGKVIISMKNISREELNVHADELLERFVRGDVSRNTEGSGLGLNIAQSLMELQKGQLQLLVDGDLFKVTLIFPGI